MKETGTFLYVEIFLTSTVIDMTFTTYVTNTKVPLGRTLRRP